jgi:hypothetical protein
MGIAMAMVSIAVDAMAEAATHAMSARGAVPASAAPQSEVTGASAVIAHQAPEAVNPGATSGRAAMSHGVTTAGANSNRARVPRPAPAPAHHRMPLVPLPCRDHRVTNRRDRAPRASVARAVHAVADVVVVAAAIAMVTAMVRHPRPA